MQETKIVFHLENCISLKGRKMNITQNNVASTEVEIKNEKQCIQLIKSDDNNNIIELDLNIDDRFISEGKTNPNYNAPNKRKLTKTFNKVLSLGLSDWLEKQRMLKAKSLLIHSDLLVNEIAIEVGYFTFKDFLDAYEERFHLTPQEQRSRLKIEVVTSATSVNT
jgi:AraC-like DNA-binding protein